ncbi:MAG: PD-(D/E)XK nuclease family protein, partial [Candidatus Omnitrophota bacterium]
LYLTSAEDYGGKRLRKVSAFVFEALGTEAKEKEKKRASAIEAIARFAPKKDSVKPQDAKMEETKPVKLSYYQIDDYITCPLKYKYVNILRVPIMEHHTVIYGRAMHEAVTRYFQFKMAGKKMQLADILSVFDSSFDPQGFLDKYHQEERSRVGKEALVRFFHAEEERDSKPKFIEKEFSFIFEGNKIAGRFDRVDEDAGGDIIIDFKTSEVKAQDIADKKSKESLQLLLYALAYEQMTGKLPLKVELFFLESGIIGSSIIMEGDLEKIKEKIRVVSSGIRSQNFQATPAYMACTYCAYSQICPSAKAR